VRLLPLALLVCAACGATRYALKPQTIEQVFETNNASGGSCPADGAPLGTIRYDVKAFNQAAGIPEDIGCLNPGVKFEVEAHVLEQDRSRLPGDSCVGPQGTVTLTGVILEYAWKTNSGALQPERLTLTCPDSVIDVSARGEDIAARVNACFAAMTGNASEWLRIGYNRRAEFLAVTPVGRCSAGACFFLQFSLRLKLLDATASVDGCP
jgi:hypothetical protein